MAALGVDGAGPVDAGAGVGGLKHLGAASDKDLAALCRSPPCLYCDRRTARTPTGRPSRELACPRRIGQPSRRGQAQLGGPTPCNLSEGWGGGPVDLGKSGKRPRSLTQETT